MQSSQVEVSIVETNLDELLTRVEQGEEIVITRRGKPVATLSQAKRVFKPFTSHTKLLASQPEAKTSSVDTLTALRDEARY